MMEFFRYESPYRTGHFIELSLLEYIMPFIVLLVLIGLLIYMKKPLSEKPQLQLKLEKIVAIVFLLIYSSHYIFRFALYQFDTIILPFQLCGISMMFAIYLLFKKTKSIHAFVLYTGVLGGIISLITPVIGYDSAYYRYYQFYIAHILLIVTPIYFMVIKGYYPTKKDTIRAFIILQVLAIFMGVFNYFNNTDFMFIFFDPKKIDKFPAIASFGGIPYYLILVEITGIILFYILYKVTILIKHYSVVQVENQNQ